MLKYILVILIVPSVALRSGGQTYDSHLGVKGGIAISNLTGNEGSEVNANYAKKQGTNFEVFIETKINKWLTFQSVGLELSSQGGKKDGFQAFSTGENFSQPFPPGQQPQYLYADINRER